MASSQFITFGAQHGIAAGIAIAGAVALPVAVRAWGTGRVERAVRWLLATACVAYEAGELWWQVHAGLAGLHEALPLHLCDVSILIAPVVLLSANRYAFELLYFWGIGGTLQALATPTLWSGFPAPICLLFFAGHGLILASALYATVVMRLRPVPRSVLRVWLVTMAYALVIFLVNLALGTNYLFIRHKPPTPSLLDLLGPWPWYLLALQPIVVAVLGLCYLPFLVRDRWQRNHSA